MQPVRRTVNIEQTDRPRLLVLGCGNVLRGDDAAGPAVIRHLEELQVPPAVRCIDAGTSGIHVVREMRSMPHVVIVDACRTDRPAGTILELSGNDIASDAPAQNINLHLFRWNDALTLGRAFLDEDYPRRITVYLVEGDSFEPGAPMTAAVDDAVRRLAARLYASFHSEEPADVPGRTGSSRIDL